VRSLFGRGARAKEETPAARWDEVHRRARMAIGTDPAVAERAMREALEIAETSFGIGDRRIFETMEELFHILCIRRKKDQSRELCDRLVERTDYYYSDDREKVADLLARLPQFCLIAGDTEKAHELYRKAIPLLLTTKVSLDATLRSALVQFADLCASLGKHDDEQYVLGMLLKRTERKRDDGLRLSARIRLAASHAAAGDLEQADRLRKTLEKELQDLPREKILEVAPDVARLAARYASAGKAAEAGDLYDLSIGEIEWNGGSSHPALIPPLAGLAHLYAATHREEDAEKLLRRIHAMRIGGFFARPWLHAAPTDDELIAFLEQRGRHEESEAVVRELVEECKRRLKGKEEVKAEVLGDLAMLARAHGAHDRAESALTELLEIRSGLPGEQSVADRFALRQLGDVLMRQGRFAEGLKHLRRALELHERSKADEWGFLADLLFLLAMAERSTGAHENAELYQSRQVAVLEEHFGPDSPAIGPPLLELARTYFILRRFPDTVKACRRILSLLQGGEEEIEGGYYGLGMTLKLLADAQIELGALAEAEQPLHRAIGAFEKAGDEGVTWTAWCLERLALIRSRAGMLPEAQALLERAVGIFGKVGENGAQAREHMEKLLAQVRAQSDAMQEMPDGGAEEDESGTRH